MATTRSTRCVSTWLSPAGAKLVHQLASWRDETPSGMTRVLVEAGALRYLRHLLDDERFTAELVADRPGLDLDALRAEVDEDLAKADRDALGTTRPRTWTTWN